MHVFNIYLLVPKRITLVSHSREKEKQQSQSTHSQYKYIQVKATKEKCVSIWWTQENDNGLTSGLSQRVVLMEELLELELTLYFLVKNGVR